MTFNLISHIWIPVRMKNGEKRVIRPADIADPEIDRIEGERPDLNAACLEFLIALVAQVDPPRDLADWQARRGQKPARFTSALNAIAPAFNLIGSGPLFMQDFENIGDRPYAPVTALFPDGRGDSRTRKVSDIGYPRAAMALFQMQMHPEGDLGQSGHMATIVDPNTGLWDMIWANVPYGKPLDPARLDAFPWMHPVASGAAPEPLGMFRMSRRVQLRYVGNRVTGAYFKGEYGAAVASHGPLVPQCYRGDNTQDREARAQAQQKPALMTTDRVGADHWVGTVLPHATADTRAACVRLQADRRPGESSVLHICGWHVPSGKAPTFVNARVAMHDFDPVGQDLLRNMISATRLVGMALRKALYRARGSVAGLDPAGCLAAATEQNVVRLALDLRRGSANKLVAGAYHMVLRNEALRLFNDFAGAGMVARSADDMDRIDAARQKLITLFDTNRPNAQALRDLLGVVQEADIKRGRHPALV